MTTPKKRNDDRLPTLLPVFRDRWFDPLRSSMARRALVVLGAALLATAAALFWIGDDGLIAGIPALLIVMTLNLTTRAMADAPAAKLDERMVKTRNAAFRSAYFVLALGLIGALAFVLATSGDEVALSRAQVLGVA